MVWRPVQTTVIVLGGLWSARMTQAGAGLFVEGFQLQVTGVEVFGAVYYGALAATGGALCKEIHNTPEGGIAFIGGAPPKLEIGNFECPQCGCEYYPNGSLQPVMTGLQCGHLVCRGCSDGALRSGQCPTCQVALEDTALCGRVPNELLNACNSGRVEKLTDALTRLGARGGAVPIAADGPYRVQLSTAVENSEHCRICTEAYTPSGDMQPVFSGPQCGHVISRKCSEVLNGDRRIPQALASACESGDADQLKAALSALARQDAGQEPRAERCGASGSGSSGSFAVETGVDVAAPAGTAGLREAAAVAPVADMSGGWEDNPAILLASQAAGDAEPEAEPLDAGDAGNTPTAASDKASPTSMISNLAATCCNSPGDEILPATARPEAADDTTEVGAAAATVSDMSVVAMLTAAAGTQASTSAATEPAEAHNTLEKTLSCPSCLLVGCLVGCGSAALWGAHIVVKSCFHQQPPGVTKIDASKIPESPPASDPSTNRLRGRSAGGCGWVQSLWIIARWITVFLVLAALILGFRFEAQPSSSPAGHARGRESGKSRVSERGALPAGAPGGAVDSGIASAAGAVDPGIASAAGAVDPGIARAAGAVDPGIARGGRLEKV